MQIICISSLHHCFRFVVIEDRRFIEYCVLQKLSFPVSFLVDVGNKLSERGVCGTCCAVSGYIHC